MTLVINRAQASGDRVVDRTSELAVIPNTIGILGPLGLFDEYYSTQKFVEIPRTTYTNHLVPDRNWDERNSTIAGRSRDFLTLKIPHYPLDDAITPQDLDGVIQANSLTEAIELESVSSVRAEKMMRIREAHALTLEKARMQIITSGTVYAPSGTMRQSYGQTVNYYTEFGVTRTEQPFSASNTDPRPAIEAARRATLVGIKNGQAGSVRGFVCLCSSTFFDALFRNPYITDAVKYIAQPQSNILVNRPDVMMNGLDARMRQFDFGGVTFIDAGIAGYDDPTTGAFVPYIPEGDAYIMPMGIRDMFKTYYAPANRLSTINKRSQGSYYFEYANTKDDFIEIMTEQNFLNALLYPQAIVRLYLTA